MLDTIAAAGYEGCEWVPSGTWPANQMTWRVGSPPRGLEMVAAYVATDLAVPISPEAFLEEVDVADHSRRR